VAVNLFIDTNIFLAFYHFSGEDLEELKKLAVLLSKEQVRLFLPGQVADEFRRNRDVKIADALKVLRDQKLSLRFPQVCKGYPEYSSLRKLQKDYESGHAALVGKVLADATAEGLKADDIIRELFSLAQPIPPTVERIGRARLRLELGNPPGKRGSLGDAVNWESLLDAVPQGESLHFVTEDSDYASPLVKGGFKTFLLQEWEDKQQSELVLYQRLSAFFAAEYPQISLASEIEKDLLIQELGTSFNFGHTHSVVAQLREFPEFTVDQAKTILAAAINNTQVNWIATDWDVRQLLTAAIMGKEGKLDAQLLEEVLKLIGPEPEPFEDLPF